MIQTKNILQIPNHLLNESRHWLNPKDFIRAKIFKKLCAEFPSIDYFEWHPGYKRHHGQRPHNRFYLAYKESLHHPEKNVTFKGLIQPNNLSETWQLFIDELETNKQYRDFMRQFLMVDDFQTRYEWHIGITGCEVSPHLDAPAKIGKHIFYFNTSDDWDVSWGGQTIVLENKLNEKMNPEYGDFSKQTATQILDNHSFLLRNSNHSWHGVKPLTCPDHKYRKILNVVWEYKDAGKKGMGYRANYI